MKLNKNGTGVNWKEAPNGARHLCQNGERVIWVDAVNVREGFTIIESNPHPQLTHEAIEAVREFREWLDTQVSVDIESVDYWLSQRGGEHE